jgi:hypothetical protein
MDAKTTRGLALFAAVSLFLTGLAWLKIAMFWARSFLRSV